LPYNDSRRKESRRNWYSLKLSFTAKIRRIGKALRRSCLSDSNTWTIAINDSGSTDLTSNNYLITTYAVVTNDVSIYGTTSNDAATYDATTYDAPTYDATTYDDAATYDATAYDDVATTYDEHGNATKHDGWRNGWIQQFRWRESNVIIINNYVHNNLK
jgi:hypothetical protein